MSDIEILKSLQSAGVEYIANFDHEKTWFIVLFDKDCQAMQNGTIDSNVAAALRYGAINLICRGNSIRNIPKLIKKLEGKGHAE